MPLRSGPPCAKRFVNASPQVDCCSIPIAEAVYDNHYVPLLDAYGSNRRMSRAGNCYDNTVMESFWSTLKSATQLDVLEPESRFKAELAVSIISDVL